jgi:hypothetical protein
MPKLDKPLYGDSATGEIASVIAFKKGIPFTSPGDEEEIPYGRLEKKRVAAVSRSTGQAAVRDAFLVAKAQWLALSDSERLAWQGCAPDPWTGFNYFMNIALRGGPLWFGEIVFYEDVLKQGNQEGLVSPEDYENNFPTSADACPPFLDGQDNFQAWLFNKMKISLLAIEAYLIQQKATIERS